MAPSVTTWTSVVVPSGGTWTPAVAAPNSVGSQVTSIVTSTTTSAGSGDTLAYDTYTDTAGVLVQNHVGASGVTYAKHPAASGGANSMQIGTSNDIFYPATAGIEYIAYANPASPEYSSQMSFNMFSSMVGENDGLGVGLRYDPTALTRYLAFWNNSVPAWQLYRTVGGSDTLLGSITTQLLLGTANPRAVKLAATGSGSCVTLTMTVDGTDIMQVADTAGARIVATGQPGFRAFNNLSGADNNSKLHLDNLLVKTLTSIVTSTTTSIGTSIVMNNLWTGAGTPTTSWLS